MSGNKVLFDTYIHNDIYISEITEMKLLGKKGITKEEIQRLQETLSDVTIIDFSKAIKLLAIDLKQSYSTRCNNCSHFYLFQFTINHRRQTI